MSALALMPSMRNVAPSMIARLRALSAILPSDAPIPELVLRGADLPTWALKVLIDVEDDGREPTEAVYRSCGRCLQPWGMSQLVFGHACQGTPVHFPAWARSVLWAVL